METVKISRVGQAKEIQTKFGLKKKTGVQFEQYPDVWHDVWADGLSVGQELTGDRSSREYNGNTYWDFKLPKKTGGASIEDITYIKNKLLSIDLQLSMIAEHIKLKVKAVDTKNNAHKEGHEHASPTAFDDDFNPEDSPF